MCISSFETFCILLTFSSQIKICGCDIDFCHTKFFFSVKDENFKILNLKKKFPNILLFRFLAISQKLEAATRDLFFLD